MLPCIDYGSFVLGGSVNLDDLREVVIKHVIRRSGILIVKGLDTHPESKAFRELLLSLQETEGLGAHRGGIDRFVEVEQRDDIVTNEASFFQFPYKSGRALACHTDASFKPEPFDIVALHCIRNDPAGGRSILVKLSDLLLRLDEHVRKMLLEVAVPFEFGMAHILRSESWGMSIRYNRREIDAYCSDESMGGMAKILDQLDLALAFENASEVFDPVPGECVLIDNRRVLHGRTQLSPDNKRLMIRGRCYVSNSERYSK